MNIYDLELHEVVVITETDYVTQTVQRVPGGWLYRTDTSLYSGFKGGGGINETFVPFNDEFIIDKKQNL